MNMHIPASNNSVSGGSQFNGWLPVSRINLGSRGTWLSGEFASTGNISVGITETGGRGMSTPSCQQTPEVSGLHSFLNWCIDINSAMAEGTTEITEAEISSIVESSDTRVGDYIIDILRETIRYDLFYVVLPIGSKFLLPISLACMTTPTQPKCVGTF